MYGRLWHTDGQGSVEQTPPGGGGGTGVRPSVMIVAKPNFSRTLWLGAPAKATRPTTALPHGKEDPQRRGRGGAAILEPNRVVVAGGPGGGGGGLGGSRVPQHM